MTRPLHRRRTQKVTMDALALIRRKKIVTDMRISYRKDKFINHWETQIFCHTYHIIPYFDRRTQTDKQTVTILVSIVYRSPGYQVYVVAKSSRRPTAGPSMNQRRSGRVALATRGVQHKRNQADKKTKQTVFVRHGKKVTNVNEYRSCQRSFWVVSLSG